MRPRQRFSLNRFHGQHEESSTTYAIMLTSRSLLNLLPRTEVRLSRSVGAGFIIPRSPRKPSFRPYVPRMMLCHYLQSCCPCGQL